MRAAGAQKFGYNTENMPEKAKIDQNQTGILLNITIFKEKRAAAKIFCISHMKITPKPLKLVVFT